MVETFLQLSDLQIQGTGQGFGVLEILLGKVAQHVALSLGQFAAYHNSVRFIQESSTADLTLKYVTEQDCQIAGSGGWHGGFTL